MEKKGNVIRFEKGGICVVVTGGQGPPVDRFLENMEERRGYKIPATVTISEKKMIQTANDFLQVGRNVLLRLRPDQALKVKKRFGDKVYLVMLEQFEEDENDIVKRLKVKSDMRWFLNAFEDIVDESKSLDAMVDFDIKWHAKKICKL